MRPVSPGIWGGSAAAERYRGWSLAVGSPEEAESTFRTDLADLRRLVRSLVNGPGPKRAI